MKSKILKNLLLGVLCTQMAATVLAQSAGTGSISGLVQDPSGSAVANATVVVANEAKGIRRNLETTSGGIFNAPALIPDANYKVTVTKSGFATFEAVNVNVTVGANVDVRVNLQVATTSTTVDVSSVGETVESSRTDVSQLVDQRQLLDLPNNSRRVDSYVLSSPGVAPDGAFGLLSFRGVAGHNSFLTDGNDTTNQFYNENAGRTRISSPISQEAVQEFQVISSNFSAEYGNAMGGVINTVTKSGSNDTHGTAYWFFRNRSLNARDRYALFNPQDIRNQFGASLGGHIIKDKLFYFANYEGTRRDFPAINSLSTGMFRGGNAESGGQSVSGSDRSGSDARAVQHGDQHDSDPQFPECLPQCDAGPGTCQARLPPERPEQPELQREHAALGFSTRHPGHGHRVQHGRADREQCGFDGSRRLRTRAMDQHNQPLAGE